MNPPSALALWNQDEGGHGVLFRSATSLGETGQVAAPRDAYTTLHDTALHHLGPDHHQTLTTRRNLAYWRERAGLDSGSSA